MFEIEDTKILLGNSLELPEEDTDEYMDDYRNEKDSLYQYYFQSIVQKMGMPDFKENFLSVFDKVQDLDFEQQQSLCYALLKKVNDTYDFEFTVNIDFDSERQIENFYDFIKFYEYDHESFLIRVWKFLNPPDLVSLDIAAFCEKNENKIIQEIEEQVNIYDFNETISEFLRTNSKENMIQWFKAKSLRLASLIKLNLIRKE